MNLKRIEPPPLQPRIARAVIRFAGDGGRELYGHAERGRSWLFAPSFLSWSNLADQPDGRLYGASSPIIQQGPDFPVCWARSRRPTQSSPVTTFRVFGTRPTRLETMIGWILDADRQFDNRPNGLRGPPLWRGLRHGHLRRDRAVQQQLPFVSHRDGTRLSV